jgi:SAM-dependent methyltransferase
MSQPLIKNIVRTVRRVSRDLSLSVRRDSVRYGNLLLPARHLRPGGSCFRADKDFAWSARKEADRLALHCGLTIDSSVVEIGCGPGRLPIGIIDRIGDIRSYQALDVSLPSIVWCRKHITRGHSSFRFIHIDVANDRYNEGGAHTQQEVQLSVDDHSADIIYLYSVFSHLKQDDVRAYLHEFRRILSPHGTVFLSAFVETGVPCESENPQDYRGGNWAGPLHCVRFEAEFFQLMLRDYGFKIIREEHGTETDGQSAFYIKRIAAEA